MLNDEKVDKLLEHLYQHQRYVAHEEIKAEKVLTVSEEQHFELYELLLHHHLVRRMYVKSKEAAEQPDMAAFQITEKGIKFCEQSDYHKLYKKWVVTEGMVEDAPPVVAPSPKPNPAPSPKPNPSQQGTQVSAQQKPMNMKLIIGIAIVVVLGVIIWYFATH